LKKTSSTVRQKSRIHHGLQVVFSKTGNRVSLTADNLTPGQQNLTGRQKLRRMSFRTRRLFQAGEEPAV
jgi:hypothetical protein